MPSHYGKKKSKNKMGKKKKMKRGGKMKRKMKR